MDFTKKFSIAHYDRFHGAYDRMYYDMMSNAEQSYINNIHDIYFGKYFYYEYKGEKRRCGNPMGVEASDSQIDYLFRLQEERGVEISLTFNTIEIPHEVIYNPDIRSQFVEWIGSYYDRGLRSCTMSSEHIMRMGILQQRCPNMRWKNTVNQIVTDAQQFIDYAYLGYNTILLDRSLNRNHRELREIKRAQDHLNSMNPKKRVMTSLLVSESCIYRCPFKKEHDSIGEVISTEYFHTVADYTCNGWRGLPSFVDLPRAGINIVASTAKTFGKFAGLVDVLKISGRLTKPVLDPEDSKYMKGAWYLTHENRLKQGISRPKEFSIAHSFEEIYENDLIPVHDWIPGWIDMRHGVPSWRETYNTYTGIWSTDKGKQLEKLLMNCKNQCWDCHECERTFGMQDIDSALQIRKNWNE